ncbi:hypothetical protein K488DRAFT_24207, partial [Vararia minispora EC-137]
CTYCNPPYPLDNKSGPFIIEHMSTHILHDRRHINREMEPCGLCLRSHEACQAQPRQIYLTKRQGKHGSVIIDWARSCCPNLTLFSYAKAAQSHKGFPCSNVPLQCPLCDTGSPAVWCYNLQYHLARIHPNINSESLSLCKLWRLSSNELAHMKDVWKDRKNRKKTCLRSRN